MKKSNESKFVQYIRRTWKNKLAAIVAVLVGLGVINIEGDGTVFVFMLMIGIPLFFARVDYVG